MPLPHMLALSSTATDFINDGELEALIDQGRPDPKQVTDVIAKALDKQPLSVAETAVLLRADAPEQIEQIFSAARELKERVYGNRIVLFAPLYIGNMCVNKCGYCGFSCDNKAVPRRTLNMRDIRDQVLALERQGHKRLIVVFGEHPRYDPEFMASCIRNIYDVHEGHGEIRRLNINAAPLDVEGYRVVKAAGIGTYQIFQETYHHETYRRYHPEGTPKGDYLWRLDGLSRAFEGGLDDVGIGALFGLADWRFEVLSLVTHALHLQRAYGVGPHTISFPRMRPASGVDTDAMPLVDDESFKRLIAILRLAVPYTGLICTAREKPEIRREVMAFGVSQIDAGSRIELGGYSEAGDAQVMEREQFTLGDVRGLDVVMRELMADGYLPSFCTACYRVGRTGEHFMEFAIPGFIKRFCSPNAMSTLMEYLIDYASPETQQVGFKAIAEEVMAMPDGKLKTELQQRLQTIQSTDQRDLLF